MKKVLAGIFCLVLALSMAFAAAAEVVKTPAADGSMNVRKGPGTNYEVVTWVKNGQAITVLENAGKWTKIRVNSTGKEGYMKSDCIAQNAAGGSDEGQSALVSVATRFPGSVVNVRKGPGTQYAVAFKTVQGAGLTVTGESGNWALIRTADGKTGYVSKNYISGGISKTTTANVNFRAGAGMSFASTAVLAKGTRVTATSVSGNWTKVTVNGATGYVYSQYLK